MNRRQFLAHACGTAAGLAGSARTLLAYTGVTPASAPSSQGAGRRKLILVVFGGGTRFSESAGDPEHRYIPRLWNEMAPRGTLFTNVRVEGTVVHTNCTASLLTGHSEYDADNDWSRPVDNPTLFEIYRKARGAPDTAAWAFVYASILAKITESRAPGYGAGYAANVVEPPTIPRTVADEMGRILQQAAASGSVQAELKAAGDAAGLARSAATISYEGLRSERARRFMEAQFKAWKNASGTTSHDAFLADGAVRCMQTFAPDVLVVAFGEIDCAHYGSWSRYVEAIRRTDELTWRLWRTAEELEAYRGRTLMLVVPDHGRELECPGGMGFIHHSNFYTGEDEDEGCRRAWMLALGPGVEGGRFVEKPVPALSVAATALKYLGLKASPGAARSVWPRIEQRHPTAGEPVLYRHSGRTGNHRWPEDKSGVP